MDIKERYWKWKRAFNKRKELIGRILSITLIVALVVIVAIASVSILKSDAERKALAGVPVDKSAIKAKKADYGEPGFRQVAENDMLILSADVTTGEICVTEKASGMKWYSNPQDREEDTYVTERPKLDSQFFVKFVNLDAGITVEFNNYNQSIKKGTMEYELVDNGIKFNFGFVTANVWIPIQYTLTEDGFQAEVVVSEIKGVGDNAFMIDTLSLLPYFGSGGLNDEGYLFVPDGSGALINFNNNKQFMQSYNAPVYGNNITIVKEKQETVRTNINLPVFGAKVNDHAFLGVITSGDACSTISAATSKADSAYNHVYASAVLSEYNLKQMEGDHRAGKSSHSIDYRDDLTDGANYCVRYFFMEGDAANYTGMSNCYRDYLIKNDLMKDSSLADKKYMVLDLVGAVSIQKYVMGVKRPVVTALTTYNDVCEIVKEMKAQGVENIIVNYIGAMDSGLNNKLYDKVSVESALGTKKEFRNMVNYLEQEGVLLFLETNPVDLYENGNGYLENKDSVRTFYDAYSFQYAYALDTATKADTTRWHLLRPALVSELTAKFASTLADWNVKNLSVNRLGDTLYSDYTETKANYISRTGVMGLWQQTLKSADEATDYLMIHGGNAYTTAYADVITDTSSSHSSYDMLDQSIPFYQLVFQNNTLLTAAAINTTVDYQYAFLKALETGSSLKYNLIYGDVSDLVGTDYNTMVSYSYDYWKGLAAEQYQNMQKAVSQFAGKEIIAHEYVTGDVTRTQYESAAVIVNYGEEAYTYEGTQIAAKDYLIVSGGAQ